MANKITKASLRFWPKVRVSGVDSGACWEWTGSKFTITTIVYKEKS